MHKYTSFQTLSRSFVCSLVLHATTSISYAQQPYFTYHNGASVPDAESFHPSVCIDYLYYNKEGTIKRIVMTNEDVKPAASK